MIHGMLQLVAAFSIPLFLQLILYALAECFFCFYFIVWKQLCKEFFIQFSWLNQSDLSDKRFEMLVCGAVKSKIVQYPLRFFPFKRFGDIQLNCVSYLFA